MFLTLTLYANAFPQDDYNDLLRALWVKITGVSREAQMTPSMKTLHSFLE